MTNPLLLQLCRCAALSEYRHPCMAVSMKSTTRDAELFQKRMEHTVAEIACVNRRTVAGLEHAPRTLRPEMLPQQISKFGSNVDDALSIFCLRELFYPIHNATTNVDHTVR